MTNDLPPTRLDRSLDMSLREWIEYYQASVVTKQVHHPGVQTWKNVFDLCVIQEIIHETQPEIVIEIGCKFWRDHALAFRHDENCCVWLGY
jgi:cephalosporin hydroxylase